MKINVNVACFTQLGAIGVGCVVRDDIGDFLHARSARITGCMQLREAEVMSLKEALLWVKNGRSTQCIFEMDAKLVVDAVHGSGGNSNFHTVIKECHEIIKHFEDVLLLFEYRSANSVAHLLARAANSMSDPMEWLSTTPDFIICNLISEEV